MVRRISLAAAALTLFGVQLAPAAAEDWPPRLGNPGTTAPRMDAYDRKSDREEGQFWRNKFEGPAPLPPAANFPGLPGPPQLRRSGPQSKSGPMTLADLHLLPDGAGGFRGKRPGYRFSIGKDGTIQFADRPPLELSPALFLGMVGMVASFDLTDVVMRLHGDDPYSYDKARVIDLTRDMRSKMTDLDRTERLRTALGNLPRQLAFVWGRRDLGLPERRRMLFFLWDELLENAATAEGRAAVDARTRIVTFIRKELPAGSPQAFTGAELLQMNARRRSRAAFAPYADDVLPVPTLR